MPGHYHGAILPWLVAPYPRLRRASLRPSELSTPVDRSRWLSTTPLTIRQMARVSVSHMPPRCRANERARSSPGVMVGSRGRSAPEFFRGRPGEHSAPLIPQPTPEPSGQSPGICACTHPGANAPGWGSFSAFPCVLSAFYGTLPPCPCQRAGASQNAP